MSDLKSVSIPIPCPDCGQDLLYFDMIDCIICDNQDGCDRYVVFVRKSKDEVN